ATPFSFESPSYLINIPSPHARLRVCGMRSRRLADSPAGFLLGGDRLSRLFQRRLQRVPRQRGALNTDRKLAHAAKRRQLAEPHALCCFALLPFSLSPFLPF